MKGRGEEGERSRSGEKEETVSILAAAIEVEKFGFEMYMRVSECVRDKKGAALLRSLANDETEHRRILEKEIMKMRPGVDLSSLAPTKKYMDLIPERIFPKEVEEKCATLEGEIGMIEIGIGVEDNSVRMYSEAAAGTANLDLKALLVDLAKWEGRHKKTLEENLHMLRLEGSWYGYLPILEG